MSRPNDKRRLTNDDFQHARTRKRQKQRTIRLAQIVAPYFVDGTEDAVVPVFTDLYYNVDDPDMPMPYSHFNNGRNSVCEIVAIDYYGRVVSGSDQECQTLISDYEAKTQYIINALEEVEKTPVVTRLIERRVPPIMWGICFVQALTVLALVAAVAMK